MAAESQTAAFTISGIPFRGIFEDGYPIRVQREYRIIKYKKNISFRPRHRV
jgi:hypothetical protein